MLTLPVRTDLSHYTMQLDLDERTFGLEFKWNARDEAWFMSISDVDGNLLAAGRKVVVGFPLLLPFKWDPRMPPGDIVAIDTTSEDRQPGLTELGDRVQLVYIPVAELVA